MEWDNYIKTLLEQRCVFDGLYLSLDGKTDGSEIPPIIKATVLILDKLIESGEKNNIIVFPEKKQSLLIFTLMKLISNIDAGKIKKSYDPHNFEKGQKLNYKNCIMEFDGIGWENGQEILFVHFADSRYGLPVEIAPFLQKSESAKLSKCQSFEKAFKGQGIQLLKGMGNAEFMKALQDFKTHMESSVFFVAPVSSTREQILNWKFNGRNISDMLFIGQVNYSGNIKNIGSGQTAGIPAIVLASDLYAVNDATKRGAPIQSLIMDISNSDAVHSQMDAFDRIMSRAIPFTCITDTANSFDMQLFIERGFNVWRWDENYITKKLYQAPFLLANKKAELCVKRTIEYIAVDDDKISNLIKRLYSHKVKVKEQSPRMMDMFAKLFTMTLNALRAITLYTDSERDAWQNNLSECLSVIQEERPFISSDAYSDYEMIIEDLKSIISPAFMLPKISALQEKIFTSQYHTAHLIVPEKSDKDYIEKYWNKWSSEENICTHFSAFYPDEYIGIAPVESVVVIICGWFNNIKMRKILYSFNAQKYVVLIYRYENRWKSVHTKTWAKSLDNTGNQAVMRQVFNMSDLKLPVKPLGIDCILPAESDVDTDELNEIELILRGSGGRRYTENNDNISGQLVQAVPVRFTGGYLAFFRNNHKVITVTDIMVNNGQKEKTKEASQLHIGDFIVLREADRDLVRELADAILNNSGKKKSRILATKWKESLRIANLSSTYSEIHEKLKAAGCSATFPTVRSWIKDENKIAPKSKEDLLCIAQVTENQELLEMIDQVYEAARIVNSAHITAGKYLSRQLRVKIASVLHGHDNNVDPFNVGEPIVLLLDNIGTVKVLKVIEVEPTIDIDSSYTNRLLEEK